MTEIIANPQAEDGADTPAVRVETAGYATASPMVFQYRVLKAVILREMSQRYGQYRLGYLLSILTPVVSIAMLMMMFSFRGKVIPSNFPMSVFIITGYPLWQGFQFMYSKVLAAAARIAEWDALGLQPRRRAWAFPLQPARHQHLRRKLRVVAQGQDDRQQHIDILHQVDKGQHLGAPAREERAHQSLGAG